LAAPRPTRLLPQPRLGPPAFTLDDSVKVLNARLRTSTTMPPSSAARALCHEFSTNLFASTLYTLPRPLPSVFVLADAFPSSETSPTPPSSPPDRHRDPRTLRTLSEQAPNISPPAIRCFPAASASSPPATPSPILTTLPPPSPPPSNNSPRKRTAWERQSPDCPFA